MASLCMVGTACWNKSEVRSNQEYFEQKDTIEKRRYLVYLY